jgi:hypothetical protein
MAEIGDRVVFRGAGHALVAVLVAEVSKSPLTGRRRLRVVDTHQEARDLDAGRWINEDELVPNIVPLD